VQLDTRGIPAVLIGTDRFHSVLVAMRDLSGVPDARWAEIAHPVQSLDREQLRQRAEEAVAQFIEIVVR
jgi:hypothetical protein